jgi:hypothetical protein
VPGFAGHRSPTLSDVLRSSPLKMRSIFGG